MKWVHPDGLSEVEHERRYRTWEHHSHTRTLDHVGGVRLFHYPGLLL